MSQKPLHILFLSAWFPNRVTPFAGDFVQRHAKIVSKRNKVTVIFAIADHSIKQVQKEIYEDGNYKEIIYYYPQSKSRGMNFLSKSNCLSLGLKEAGTIDIIHANVIDYYLFWVFQQKQLKKLPLVISEHWTGFYRPLGFLKKKLATMAGRNASYLFPVSHNLKAAMEDNGVEGQYEVIPNVINTELFHPVERAPNERPIFFHASMLNDDHKNISGQLRVAKRLYEKGFDFEFHIGGNGDNAFVKKFIQENNLQDVVKTFGALTHQQVAEKMKQSDCFVLFSNYETQSIVCLEAFACGVPVIATHVGGLTENFQGDYGILIDKGEEEQLEQAMIEIIQGRRFATKEEMHNFVQANYSAEQLAEQFTKYYHLALANK